MYLDMRFKIIWTACFDNLNSKRFHNLKPKRFLKFEIETFFFVPLEKLEARKPPEVTSQPATLHFRYRPFLTDVDQKSNFKVDFLPETVLRIFGYREDQRVLGILIIMSPPYYHSLCRTPNTIPSLGCSPYLLKPKHLPRLTETEAGLALHIKCGNPCCM
jgi:hypothetical protein